MDEATIKRIARSLGYSVYLCRYEKRSGSPRSQDRQGHYVQIVNGNVTRSIGKFEIDVSQLSEEQFVARIEAKFAPPPVTETISGKEFMDILMGKRE